MPFTDDQKREIIRKDLTGELTPAQSNALKQLRELGEFPPRLGSAEQPDVVSAMGFRAKTTVPPPATRRAVAEFAGGTVGALMMPGGVAGRMVGAGLGEAAGSVFSERFDPSMDPAARAATTGLIGAGAQGLGDLAGAGLRGGIKLLFRGGKKGRMEVLSSLEDFGKVGVTPTLAQATKRAAFDNLEQTISRIPGGAARMKTVVRSVSERVAKETQKLASRLASPSVDATMAGRKIQASIENDFLTRFKDKADALFTNLGRYMPKDRAVSVANTQGTLRLLAQPLETRPSLGKALVNPKIRQIAAGFEKDVADGTLTFGELQQLRSAVGRLLADNTLIADAPKGQLKQLYAALSNDMRSALGSPKAIAAFERANKFYAAGLDRIEAFLDPLIKKGVPEDVFEALHRSGKTGATKLRAVRRSVDPEAWNALVSVSLRRLGTAQPSAQDAAGGLFSFETFLTNWNRLDPAARTALFEGSRFRGAKTQLDEIGKTLTSIARSAERVRESSQFFKNPSGTAQAVAGIGGFTLMNIGISQAFLETGQIPAALPFAIGLSFIEANAAARLMTSPSFIRWLGQATKISNKSITGHLARLGSITAKSDMETQQAIADYLTVFENIGRKKDERKQ